MLAAPSSRPLTTGHGSSKAGAMCSKLTDLRSGYMTQLPRFCKAAETPEDQELPVVGPLGFVPTKMQTGLSLSSASFLTLEPLCFVMWATGFTAGCHSFLGLVAEVGITGFQIRFSVAAGNHVSARLFSPLSLRWRSKLSGTT